MLWWHAVILGLVEGITEYLPVSSTGHLIITSSLLGLKDPKSKDAIDAFEIIVQGGAILAVVGLYWPRFIQMLRGLLGRDKAGLALLIKIAIAFMPAAIVGLATKKWINAHLFYPGPVVAAFFVGGAYMILIELWRSGKFSRPGYSGGSRLGPDGRSIVQGGKGIDDMSAFDALRIGLFQIVALWPGTSRSMMTITGGYFSRLRPGAAAEFSFLLGVPTLLAATLKALYDDYKAAHPPAGSLVAAEPMFYKVLGPMPVVIGLVVAAISAALAVRWLVGFLNRRGLAPFGVYRIVLAIALLGLIMGKIIVIAPESKGASVPVKAASVEGVGAGAQQVGLVDGR